MTRLRRGRGPTEAPSVSFERPGFRFTYEMPLVHSIEYVNPKPTEQLKKWARRFVKRFKKNKEINV
jgi:hypothetical protein